MVSMDDPSNAAAKNKKWPRVLPSFLSKGTAAPPSNLKASVTAGQGWLTAGGGLRGKSPQGGGGGVRRAPSRHVSKSKSYSVKTPRTILYTVAAVFLLLPLTIFFWKETHLHKDETGQHQHQHSKTLRGKGGHHHHHNAFVTWMEDAEKEASDEHILDVPNNNDNDSNTTIAGMIGDFLGLTHDDSDDDPKNNHHHHDHHHHASSNTTNSHDKIPNGTGDEEYDNVKSPQSSTNKNGHEEQLMQDLSPDVVNAEKGNVTNLHKSNNGHGQLLLDLEEASNNEQHLDEKKAQDELERADSNPEQRAAVGRLGNQTITTKASAAQNGGSAASMIDGDAPKETSSETEKPEPS